MPSDSVPRLLDDVTLELSSVVANNAMNRGRGLAGVNSYARELGFDPYERLVDRVRGDSRAAVTWIDVCCGSGRALLEAEARFAQEFPKAEVTLIGIDLVDFFLARPRTPRLWLITASATTWTPDRPADLVTCVHGLHYIGDKLAAVSAMAGWIAPGGLFAADFDPDEILTADGAPAGTVVIDALRASGMTYDRRKRHLRGQGPRSPRFPATYLGADDTAGPGYTGQPSVRSYYAW
ncbi:class I SAM-dependent methyltransferase [Nocardia sp. NPDC057663]|uniref:class I SAM-dependent methyltransferase n=1 Tax=Nocardia sp. NPDC057663 TaxID=3346201 RepID=UPI00366DAD05